jgi:cbb3-type cytochrome oxidase subunit 1
MPRLSVWMIRTALIHLLLGFTIGALLLANKGVLIDPFLWRLLPIHIEFLLLGWTLQLALGVAFWILPRFQNERPRSSLAWLAYILLNVGIGLVAISLIFVATPMLVFYGRLAEVGAVAAFALHAWPRVKPPLAL